MDGNCAIKSCLMPGQLVSVTFNANLLDGIDFSTFGIHHHQKIFYEQIRLSTWPSCNDYFGAKIKVQEGDVATIIKKMGRPTTICVKDKWAIYDIYEVLINGEVCQTFRCHLLPSTFLK